MCLLFCLISFFYITFFMDQIVSNTQTVTYAESNDYFPEKNSKLKNNEKLKETACLSNLNLLISDDFKALM